MSLYNKFKFGVILGSGLDVISESFPNTKIISQQLDGIHTKRVILVQSLETPMVLFSGRKHYYEGYTGEELTANIKQAKQLGMEYLLITNAAGGINENLEESDLMLIRSHVNLNPKLIHKRNNFKYDKYLAERFKQICFDENIKFHEGVYAYLPGPAYETNSEISLLRKTGADAAGMSTVPEALDAVKRGMKVLAVSVITNLLKENNRIETSHDYVLKTSQKASEKLLFVVKRLANELK